MKTHTVTLIPGDGVGPEIADAVVQILEAAKAPIQWERPIVSTESVEPGGQLISEEALASIRKNTVALKGSLKASTAPRPILPGRGKRTRRLSC